MKSIKEKAEEYGLLNPNIHYDEDGNDYDDVDTPSIDFEAGANYVLEEIEKKLDEFINYDDSLIISRIIEQLKK